MAKQHPTFEIRDAAGRQFKGVLMGSNGKLVWSTERYPEKRLVRKAIGVAFHAVDAARAGAPVVMDCTKKRKPV